MRWPASPPAVPPLPATTPPGPVLFVDRDGVVLVEKDYLDDPREVELLPGVAAALRRARAAGMRIVGLSNQSGLGRGRFNDTQFDAVMRRLDEILAGEGAPLDAFFYVHAPAEACRCRKPATGLLEEAAGEIAWDPRRSWMVGDKVSDVDLALAAGLRPILVRTGHGRVQERRLASREGVLVEDDLAAAVAAILGEGAP